MNKFEKLLLQELISKLLLEKYKMEFGNKYVFGFDDAIRILDKRIGEVYERDIENKNT